MEIVYVVIVGEDEVIYAGVDKNFSMSLAIQEAKNGSVVIFKEFSNGVLQYSAEIKNEQ